MEHGHSSETFGLLLITGRHVLFGWSVLSSIAVDTDKYEFKKAIVVVSHPNYRPTHQETKQHFCIRSQDFILLIVP